MRFLNIQNLMPVSSLRVGRVSGKYLDEEKAAHELKGRELKGCKNGLYASGPCLQVYINLLDARRCFNSSSREDSSQKATANLNSKNANNPNLAKILYDYYIAHDEAHFCSHRRVLLLRNLRGCKSSTGERSQRARPKRGP